MIQHDNQKRRFSLTFIAVALSFCTVIVLLVDINKPAAYDALFLLPLTFGLLSIICQHLYREVFVNFGITLILILLATRMVISPLLMVFGEYSATIDKNIDQNMLKAIVLVMYETITLFFLMMYMASREKFSKQKTSPSITPKIMTIYTVILVFLLMFLAVCLIITPQILKPYRTIFQIGDELFTVMEDSYIISQYGKTLVTKFSLVTGIYLMRALTLLVPAYIIVMLAKHKQFLHVKIFSFLATIFPLFFIPGAIATSLIYMICLLLFRNYMFFGGKLGKRTIAIFTVAVLAVIAWWLFRSGKDGIFVRFSRRFSAYFSGVNVVSGVFNLSGTPMQRLDYFLKDFTTSIPYGHTIFGVSGQTVSTFFNTLNESAGQIPPTIGMGYYYFGPIFAPLYSIIFAYVAVSAGMKLKENHNNNPFRCLRLLVTTFYFCMGIVMYNIEITLTNFFSLILPMLIIEKLSYSKKERV